ncbi:MAG: M15 family metallopeptidase [Oscillospiraceae bacterium]|nr:M15 family metallopeptidase [Oscillospiraceae bacterium]
MKSRTKGTAAALLVIVISGGVFYAASSKGKLPRSAPPVTSAVTLPPELWDAAKTKTEKTAAAPAASKTEAAKSENTKTAAATAGTTAKPESTTAKSGGYSYSYANIQPAIAAMNEAQWNLLLVNRDFALPQSYAPETAVCLPGVYPENREMEKRAAAAYRKMYYAALKDGAELVPYSGYRRTSTQKSNFENRIASYRAQGYSEAESVNLAAQSILPPGCSEHEAGLAMDIVKPGSWELSEAFENSKEFQWLKKNAADYGFILRYPRGKESVTKISYEPWHWRYVGEEAAKVIMASGMTLEEYLNGNR